MLENLIASCVPRVRMKRTPEGCSLRRLKKKKKKEKTKNKRKLQ